MNKKSTHISTSQKNNLIELMRKNEQLLSGRFSSTFTKKDGQKQWENISAILNAIPGAQKEWHQWRKTWQDLRSKAKQKKALCVKHASGTGGGPPLIEEISHDEDKILSLISQVAVEGHSQTAESTVEFEFVEMLPQVIDDKLPSDLQIITEMDHDYTVERHGLITNKEPTPSSSTQTYGLITNKEPTPSSSTQTYGFTTNKEPKPSPNSMSTTAHTWTPSVKRRKRLQNSINATEKLAELAAQKLNIKKQYLQKKLEILERIAASKERDVHVKERIATALEYLIEK